MRQYYIRSPGPPTLATVEVDFDNGPWHNTPLEAWTHYKNGRVEKVQDLHVKANTFQADVDFANLEIAKLSPDLLS